ncbi:MAG: hypothetical protein ABI995_11110 [Acidobacteriota bacterium]
MLEAMGCREEAFDALRLAEKESCPTLRMLAVDPKLVTLRPDPRFAELQKRLLVDRDILSVPASAA